MDPYNTQGPRYLTATGMPVPGYTGSMPRVPEQEIPEPAKRIKSIPGKLNSEFAF
jgi:hypothetical protein